ncbi:dTDP-4-dehydrorhamnose 3,5-epimerase [Ahrensia kielensis]|uniref:dTDP-4-dehydrorhamnose 3,5-epimerase n=1 Tax=Ahrensia kielensis TaxID=76980 RepID=UPI0003A13917|nr:dTDP-4-dehydrorhamnose 3,5-epimerase [Ahrensia kielensis]
MRFTNSELAGVKIIEPSVYGDERGFFFESFNQQNFESAVGGSVRFVQDNHSKSTKGVLRGLHYQLGPKAQGKLVRVIQGEVYDVVVDIRKFSPTFGSWFGQILSSENKKQVWIPEGFAHGFLTLSDTAEFLYKTTNYYAPEFERTIRWDDPTIQINWPSDLAPIVSRKDHMAKDFQSADVFTEDPDRLK